MRALDIVIAAALLAALFGIRDWMAPAEAPLAGTIRVVDGDTLERGGQRIRLSGMDAPELAQTCERGGQDYPCGEVARDALVGLVRDVAVTCRSSGRDRYERLLAVCEVAGRDLGRALVRAGLAVPYGDYALEGAAARAERRGLWAGSFEMPSQWRRSHPRGREARGARAGAAGAPAALVAR